MNLISSIHDTPIDAIVETHHQSEVERSETIPSELEINIELYSAGFFDGVTGLDAQLPHFKDYWDGYALGYREYCCGLLGVKIPTLEIPLERLTGL
ncbi:MAG: hypothetical protein QNJ41_05080 [Xenococcaceae cyanobacterium MO_188.B32]|nr:hypothetical protein [Xenococcaceae cyanobacterium MO_188.B32]